MKVYWNCNPDSNIVASPVSVLHCWWDCVCELTCNSVIMGPGVQNVIFRLPSRLWKTVLFPSFHVSDNVKGIFRFESLHGANVVWWDCVSERAGYSVVMGLVWF